MCGRYVVTNAVTKTSRIVKSAIQAEDNENYNAHPYQKLPVIKKYKNGDFDETIINIMQNYEEILTIILPTLRSERKKTYQIV